MFSRFLVLMFFGALGLLGVESLGAEGASSVPTGPGVHGLSARGKPLHGPNFKGFNGYNHNAPKGGTVYLPDVGGFFETLNPYISGAKCAQGMSRGNFLIFDTLLERSPDEPYTMYARLAEKAWLAKDRSWVIFQLNPKARFRDGTPVLAEDVKFSFETMAAKGLPVHRSYAEKIKEIHILSKHRIQFFFHAKGDGRFDREAPTIVAERPIFSKADLLKHPFGEEPFRPMMGSGPYQVTHVDPGKSITYERRKDYWGWDLPIVKGRFNFDKIVYQTYASDAVAFEALKRGDLSMMEDNSPNRWENGYTFPAYKAGKVQKREIFFNDIAPVTFLVFNLARSPFNNRYVRLGIRHLCDTRGMNTFLLKGAYGLTDSHYANLPFAAPLDMDADAHEMLKNIAAKPKPGFFDSLIPFSALDLTCRQRIQKAHAAFQMAGFTFKNGLVRDAGGKPLTIEVVVGDGALEGPLLYIARDLKKAGVTMNVRVLDDAHYKRCLSERAYDMTVTSYATGLAPGNEQQVYYAGLFANVPSRNHAGFNDPLADQICDKVIRAETVDEQYAYMRLLDRALRSSLAFIPLFYKNRSCWAVSSQIGIPAYRGVNVVGLHAYWMKPKTPAPPTAK